VDAPKEVALSRFILLGIGKFLALTLICMTLGLTVVVSVSIYSTERTKSAEFDARHAEAVVRRQELDLALKRQEVERARTDFEKQNQRNIGGEIREPQKQKGNKK
jgi:hypothetical protein